MFRFRLLPSLRTIKRNYAFEKYAAKYSYFELLKQKFNNLNPSAFSLLVRDQWFESFNFFYLFFII